MAAAPLDTATIAQLEGAFTTLTSTATTLKSQASKTAQIGQGLTQNTNTLNQRLTAVTQGKQWTGDGATDFMQHAQVAQQHGANLGQALGTGAAGSGTVSGAMSFLATSIDSAQEAFHTSHDAWTTYTQAASLAFRQWIMDASTGRAGGGDVATMQGNSTSTTSGITENLWLRYQGGGFQTDALAVVTAPTGGPAVVTLTLIPSGVPDGAVQQGRVAPASGTVSAAQIVTASQDQYLSLLRTTLRNLGTAYRQGTASIPPVPRSPTLQTNSGTQPGQQQLTNPPLGGPLTTPNLTGAGPGSLNPAGGATGPSSPLSNGGGAATPGGLAAGGLPAGAPATGAGANAPTSLAGMPTATAPTGTGLGTLPPTIGTGTASLPPTTGTGSPIIPGGGVPITGVPITGVGGRPGATVPGGGRLSPLRPGIGGGVPLLPITGIGGGGGGSRFGSGAVGENPFAPGGGRLGTGANGLVGEGLPGNGAGGGPLAESLVPAAQRAAAGEAAVAADAAGGMPMMPFMPMGGGMGAGGSDNDRRRNAWLEEDDVWSAGTDPAPAVIGHG